MSINGLSGKIGRLFFRLFNTMHQHHDLHPSLVPAAMLTAAGSLAALFDVDNTLLPGQACETKFFRYLWRRGIVGWTELARSASWMYRHIPPLSFHPLRQQKVYLEGKDAAVIEGCAKEFFHTELFHSLSTRGRDRLEAHRQSGHHIILVTGAPDFLVAPLAELLQVPTLFAARLERQNGRYTGQVLPPLPYGIGKRDLVVAHAQEKALDLASSFAYGDSPGDTELLELVRYPVVVNPIRGMGRIARDRGWPVVDWTERCG